MNKLFLILITISGLANADGKIDDNLISRCSFVMEIFAIMAHDPSMKKLSNKEYQDALTTVAAHYKTMNYFMVYSGSGMGNQEKTDSILQSKKQSLANEFNSDTNAIAEGVSICTGSFKRLSDENRLKVDKWFGDGFYDKATTLDEQILIKSYSAAYEEKGTEEKGTEEKGTDLFIAPHD